MFRLNIQNREYQYNSSLLTLLLALLLGGLTVPPANAYYIKWLESLECYYDKSQFEVVDASGYSTYTLPSYEFDFNHDLLWFKDGSATLVVTGEDPGDQRADFHAFRMKADLQIHKSIPQEAPVTEVTLASLGWLDLSALPATEGRTKKDYVVGHLSSWVAGTGLQTHMTHYLEDGLHKYLLGSEHDQELLAIDTTYSFYVDVYTGISRIWDG